MIITSEDFQERVLNNPKLVLVDFYADWCGPCKSLAPILENLASEVEESCEIVKINVDNDRDLAGEFGIMSIPTLILFKDGKAIKKLNGFQNLETLRKFIEE